MLTGKPSSDRNFLMPGSKELVWAVFESNPNLPEFGTDFNFFSEESNLPLPKEGAVNLIAPLPSSAVHLDLPCDQVAVAVVDAFNTLPVQGVEGLDDPPAIQCCQNGHNGGGPPVSPPGSGPGPGAPGFDGNFRGTSSDPAISSAPPKLSGAEQSPGELLMVIFNLPPENKNIDGTRNVRGVGITFIELPVGVSGDSTAGLFACPPIQADFNSPPGGALKAVASPDDCGELEKAIPLADFFKDLAGNGSVAVMGLGALIAPLVPILASPPGLVVVGGLVVSYYVWVYVSAPTLADAVNQLIRECYPCFLWEAALLGYNAVVQYSVMAIMTSSIPRILDVQVRGNRKDCCNGLCLAFSEFWLPFEAEAGQVVDCARSCSSSCQRTGDPVDWSADEGIPETPPGEVPPTWDVTPIDSWPALRDRIPVQGNAGCDYFGRVAYWICSRRGPQLSM